MNNKTYKLPNGKKAVFEYDIFGIGKITLECMDQLMGMIADRPQGEWQYVYKGKWMFRRCSCCDWTQTYDDSKYMGYRYNFCPNCGARMKGADDEDN